MDEQENDFPDCLKYYRTSQKELEKVLPDFPTKDKFFIRYDDYFKGKNKIVVKHSADKSVCIETTKKITKEDVKQISEKMKSIVDANLPITRVTVLKKEAIEITQATDDDDW